VVVTTPTDPVLRRVAGRYLLGRALGRGAMGTVWAAHDEVLGRAVAVKEVLVPPGLPDAEADVLRERSLREARAIAALSHPNVVTLYDVVRENDAPFVVMELVASDSLAALLRGGPLPVERVIGVGAAVAAALQAAHAAGITHRDVKPGNVLMARDGRIKLTDFGIARNLAEQTMTGTGLMLGSPAYIAPEVATGGRVGPAADLWGLGATLFAAVEGRPPYDAGDPMATVSSVVLGEVPTPSCSGPLAEVIGGLMVKDPAGRMPLSQVRRLLGPPPVAEPAMVSPSAVSPSAPPPNGPEAAGGRLAAAGGRLAADPGPLPFTSKSRPGSSAHGSLAVARHTVDGPSRAARTGPARRGPLRAAVLWTLAALLFLGAASGGFGAARIASGVSALPVLGMRAEPEPTAPAGEHTVLVTHRFEIAEANGSRPATFTLGVPDGWLEFREHGVLGKDSGVVVRFVSPDGSRLIAVERATGFLATATAERYLNSYQRALAAAVPDLVAARSEPLSGGALDATFRTMEGEGADGQLRRTSYLRLIPAGPDLWVVRVAVPTEQEGAGRTELFEPVVGGFAPGT
jgi:eukaryotic-like serine/threonine-protein kinase